MAPKSVPRGIQKILGDLSADLRIHEVAMDGTCLIHAILYALREEYRESDDADVQQTMGQEFREEWAAWVRKETKKKKPVAAVEAFRAAFETPEALEARLRELETCWDGDPAYYLGDDVMSLLEHRLGVGLQVFQEDGLYCRGRRVDDYKKLILLRHSSNHFEPILEQGKKNTWKGVFTPRDLLYKTMVDVEKQRCRTPESPKTPEKQDNAGSQEKNRKQDGDKDEDPDEDAYFAPPAKRKKRTEVSPAQWVLENKAGFDPWIQKTFGLEHYAKPANPVASGFKAPRQHQRLVRDYMQASSPYRGVLLNHSLGSGKTCTAIGIAEALINQRKVYVLLPAYLSTNFLQELQETCGHESSLLQQSWRFWSLEKHPELRSTSREISSKLLEKQGGLWKPAEDGKHWGVLDTASRNQIQGQLNEMLRRHYHIIHYDGISAKKAQAMQRQAKNPFDNSVVIIDEAHNFISPVVNTVMQNKQGTKSPRAILYDLLMKAEHVKLVLMTGTLIINHVHEVAFLLNLLRGQRTLWQFSLDSPLRSEHMRYLQNHPDIYHFDVQNHLVRIELVPAHFRNKPNTKYRNHFVEERKPPMDETATLSEIGEQLPLKPRVRVREIHSTLFPDDPETFEQMFVDKERYRMRNVVSFQKGIRGLVSTFENRDRAMYPTLDHMHEVNCPMSDEQFAVYLQQRQGEMKEESNQAKARKKNANSPTQSTFRMKSRAISNFAFPSEMERPYPLKAHQRRAFRAELDLEEDEKMLEEALDPGTEDSTKALTDKEADAVYRKKLQAALRFVDPSRSSYLLGDNLWKYSPKMASIREHLKKPGLALIYSQFRTIEGLGIMPMVLQGAGWKEFPLVKESDGWRIPPLAAADREAFQKRPTYGIYTSDAERNRLLVSIFNGEQREALQALGYPYHDNFHGAVMKCLMITRSGSEGISLRNVRHVHIMEPYWNPVRIRQVIGRAIRMGSHLSLSESDRNVQVWLYKATLRPEQASQVRADKGLSVDQLVHSMAMKKDLLFQNVYEVIRAGSWDCGIHQFTGVQCFQPRKDIAPGEPLYLFSLRPEEDPKASKSDLKAVRIQGVQYVYDASTGDLMDYDEYTERKRIRVLGRMSRADNGVSMHVRMIAPTMPKKD